MLLRPVTISQRAVPIQVCYIIPIDAPAAMLSAIFQECYERWGGRDSLLIPMLSDGTIDERYWAWARALDPDIIYSYVDLDVTLLERIDHDLMPTIVKVHRNDLRPGDFRPMHDDAAAGLTAMSLLPMLSNIDRLGPPRRYALVSAFQSWTRDAFVTDSFGLNPYGPGWAQAEMVRKYVDTLALGSQASAQRGHNADFEVGDATALLRTISDGTYLGLTMAQLSGWGYGDVFYDATSAWRTFNIVVGDSTLDRIAFWNCRIGPDDYQRRSIVAVRVDADRLQDPEFVDALALFISRWNTSTSPNGPSHAAIRSSSIGQAQLRPLVEVLLKKNVHATVETFSDANACVPKGETRRGIVRYGLDQRYLESKIPLSPEQPAHLVNVGPVSTWFTQGSWALRLLIKREPKYSNVSYSSIPSMPIPRRWQAVRSVVGGHPAKAATGGDLRLLVKSAQKPPILSFTDDDAAFVASLFVPSHYLWTTDPRNVLPRPDAIYPQTSSAGRHLIGFLNRLGDIRVAYDMLEDQFWKAVLLDMAVPREAFDAKKRSELAQKLQNIVAKKGPNKLDDVADFENLAETVARVAPDLKSPDARRNYDWFVEMYRETDDAKRPRDSGLGPDEIKREIDEEVERKLRECCIDGVLVQGHAWRCPRCLHTNWATVADVRPILRCEVCLRETALPANFTWDFLLDNYAEIGLRERGLRGLVWALGYLSGSSDSFIFAPPLDLMHNGKKLTDADIACVADQKFVIGEVKESARHINDRLGDSLVSVARLVRPDVVVLACYDPTSVNVVNVQVQRMQAALVDLGIRVMPLVRREQDSGFPAIVVGKGFWMNAALTVVSAQPAAPQAVPNPVPLPSPAPQTESAETQPIPSVSPLTRFLRRLGLR